MFPGTAPWSVQGAPIHPFYEGYFMFLLLAIGAGIVAGGFIITGIASGGLSDLASDLVAGR